MYNMKDLVFILPGRKIYEKYIYFIVFFNYIQNNVKLQTLSVNDNYYLWLNMWLII